MTTTAPSPPPGRAASPRSADAHYVPHSDPHPSPALAVGKAPGDGMPGEYNDGNAWLVAGFRCHRRVSLVALVVGWTGAWLSLWGAALGAVVGVMAACGLVTISAPLFATLGGGQAITVVSIVAGVALGAAGGFLFVVHLLVAKPIALLGSLVAGAILSAAIVVGIACVERWTLRMRGHRRLSRDEVRRVAPLVQQLAERMSVPALPRFAMEDSVIPNAWTHMRTVVMTTGLLQTMTDEELRAVLVHELHHWRRGDAAGLRCIWAAALPAALLYNLGVVFAGRQPDPSGKHRNMVATFRAVLGWVILWPTWVITRLLIAPLTASSQRRYEYQADHSAAVLGIGADLQSALRKLGAFEGGRTGWEQAMAATHPPVELRIEALQPRQQDDWAYQEDELGVSWREVRRLLGSLLPGHSAPRTSPTTAPRA